MAEDDSLDKLYGGKAPRFAKALFSFALISFWAIVAVLGVLQIYYFWSGPGADWDQMNSFFHVRGIHLKYIGPTVGPVIINSLYFIFGLFGFVVAFGLFCRLRKRFKA